MYAQVKNGAVVKELRELPKAHRFSDGRSTGNFDLMDQTTRIDEGFYPLIDNPPAYEAHQRAEPDGYDIGTDLVTKQYIVEVRPIDELRAEKLRELEMLSAEKLNSGTFQFGGDDFNFSLATASSVSELEASVLAGHSFPTPFSWTNAEGAEVPMDHEQFVQFGLAVRNYKLGIFQQQKIHRAMINGLTDAAAVAAYDLAGGW